MNIIELGEHLKLCFLVILVYSYSSSPLASCHSICLFLLDPLPHLSHEANSQGTTYEALPFHPGQSIVIPRPRLPSCSLSYPRPIPVLLSCILHQVCTLPYPALIFYQASSRHTHIIYSVKFKLVIAQVYRTYLSTWFLMMHFINP